MAGGVTAGVAVRAGEAGAGVAGAADTAGIGDVAEAAGALGMAAATGATGAARTGVAGAGVLTAWVVVTGRGVAGTPLDTERFDAGGSADLHNVWRDEKNTRNTEISLKCRNHKHKISQKKSPER